MRPGDRQRVFTQPRPEADIGEFVWSILLHHF
jgi:hypothetical protein